MGRCALKTTAAARAGGRRHRRVLFLLREEARPKRKQQRNGGNGLLQEVIPKSAGLFCQWPKVVTESAHGQRFQHEQFVSWPAESTGQSVGECQACLSAFAVETLTGHSLQFAIVPTFRGRGENATAACLWRGQCSPVAGHATKGRDVDGGANRSRLSVLGGFGSAFGLKRRCSP